MGLIYILRRLFLPKHRSTMEWHMLRLLNKDRKRHGLSALFMQDDLREVARKHSKDMAKNDYFEHENLSGHSHADRYKRAGISELISGENLAKIRGYKFPTKRAEKGLMNSPGHRANILNKTYNCVGVGLHKSENQTYYYTQNFAYRDIQLLGRVPKSVNIKKGLNLRFKRVTGVKFGMYRLKSGFEVVREKGFNINEGHNSLQISIKEKGFYTLEIYTSSSRGGSYRASNSFSFYVRSGWFS